MHVSGDTCIQLSRRDRSQAVSGIYRLWADAHFEPEACARALTELIAQRRLPSDWFDVGAILRGGRAATDRLLYDEFLRDEGWYWHFTTASQGATFDVSLPGEDVADVAQIIRDLSRTPSAAAFHERWAESLDEDVLSVLGSCFSDEADEAPFGRWPAIKQPGIYRREHASLIIRSRTTTIITDPQGYAPGWTTQDSRFPRDDNPLRADAVLITHHHNDHWHLPSILRCADAETVVVIPRVPRTNLLCQDDFAAVLTRADVRNHIADWWTTLRIGDIEIQALPFYGEQPTRSAPLSDAGVRSWGNCYRVTCPDFSIMLLVDSGIDPMGNMSEAISESTRRNGPVDVVASCCLSFPEVLNAGLPTYVLAVDFALLQSLHAATLRGEWQSMTGGPAGVVDACAAAQARFFLPYAHGFAGLGHQVQGEDYARTRAPANAAGEAEGLALQRGLPTKFVRWVPGDVAQWKNGDLKIMSWEK